MKHLWQMFLSWWTRTPAEVKQMRAEQPEIRKKFFSHQPTHRFNARGKHPLHKSHFGTFAPCRPFRTRRAG